MILLQVSKLFTNLIGKIIGLFIGKLRIFFNRQPFARTETAFKGGVKRVSSRILHINGVSFIIVLSDSVFVGIDSKYLSS